MSRTTLRCPSVRRSLTFATYNPGRVDRAMLSDADGRQYLIATLNGLPVGELCVQDGADISVAAIARQVNPKATGCPERGTADDLAVCLGAKMAWLPGAPRLAVRTCDCDLSECDLYSGCREP